PPADAGAPDTGLPPDLAPRSADATADRGGLADAAAPPIAPVMAGGCACRSARSEAPWSGPCLLIALMALGARRRGKAPPDRLLSLPVVAKAEAALAAGAVGGQSLLESVYREHAALVKRWALRLGGPAIDVEDTVQEVFLVVQRRLPEFRGDARI